MRIDARTAVRRLPTFEEQVLVVAVPPTAANHRPNVAVDRFHLAEGDLDVAVGEDAVEVATEELGDLVKGREPRLRRCSPRGAPIAP